MQEPENESSSVFDLQAIAAFQGIETLHFRRTMNSTNDMALHWASESQPTFPALVLTEEQHSGRGRGENLWNSSEGSLTFSVVLDSNRLRKLPITLLSLATGLSVAKFLEVQCPPNSVQLKWPNDVFANERKIAGLLIETTPTATVIGIGVNVYNQPTSENAISLQQATHRKIELQTVLIGLLDSFMHVLELAEQNPTELLRQCESRMAWIGEPVQLLVGENRLSGVFSGLDRCGGLVLRNGDEERTIFSATQLRPARS